MGMDIHVKVLRRNAETQKWDKLSLFFKNAVGEQEETEPLDYYRNRELFRQIKEELPSSPVKFDLIGEGREEIEECTTAEGYFGFAEINLFKLQAYVKKHSKVRDFEAEAEYYELYNKEPKKPIMMKSPLKEFYKQIRWFIHYADPLGWEDLDEYKVVYFFDW